MGGIRGMFSTPTPLIRIAASWVRGPSAPSVRTRHVFDRGSQRASVTRVSKRVCAPSA